MEPLGTPREANVVMEPFSEDSFFGSFRESGEKEYRIGVFHIEALYVWNPENFSQLRVCNVVSVQDFIESLPTESHRHPPRQQKNTNPKKQS